MTLLSVEPTTRYQSVDYSSICVYFIWKESPRPSPQTDTEIKTRKNGKTWKRKGKEEWGDRNKPEKLKVGRGSVDRQEKEEEMEEMRTREENKMKESHKMKGRR